MLFCDNLEKIIFNRHLIIDADELVVISGYVGPSPIKKLLDLPIKSKVIYGMYATDGIRKQLHESLVSIDEIDSKLEIYYSEIPIHAKCYIWRKRGSIVQALIGSANFSTNGLSKPYKEILGEATIDSFDTLASYIKMIDSNSIHCKEGSINQKQGSFGEIGEQNTEDRDSTNSNVCRIILYDPKTNEVQNANGLNWGMGNGHTKANDANIPIRKEFIRKYPMLFPEKQIGISGKGTKAKKTRQNDSIELIWDDGTTMEGLLEGNNDIDGKHYPKQICSAPKKCILGEYIRGRLGVPLGQKVTKKDLEKYGRYHIDVSLQAEGIYYLDFSV